MRDERDVMSKHHGKTALIVKILLWFYAACTMFVLVYMTYQSLRPKREVLSKTFSLPETITLDNYVELFTDEHFLRYFGNSVFVW